MRRLSCPLHSHRHPRPKAIRSAPRPKRQSSQTTHRFKLTGPVRSSRLAGMGTPISSIRNLGPAMEHTFKDVGIATAEELRALGADAAYGRVLAAGGRPHFIAYYALHMALQGRPWNDCKGEEKQKLRLIFDALKASRHDKGRSQLEAALDAIGVVEKKA